MKQIPVFSPAHCSSPGRWLLVFFVLLYNLGANPGVAAANSATNSATPLCVAALPGQNLASPPYAPTPARDHDAHRLCCLFHCSAQIAPPTARFFVPPRRAPERSDRRFDFSAALPGAPPARGAKFARAPPAPHF
jgi:hypothetical protein